MKQLLFIGIEWRVWDKAGEIRMMAGKNGFQTVAVCHSLKEVQAGTQFSDHPFNTHVDGGANFNALWQAACEFAVLVEALKALNVPALDTQSIKNASTLLL